MVFNTKNMQQTQFLNDLRTFTGSKTQKNQGLPEDAVYPGEEKTPTPVFDLGQAG